MTAIMTALGVIGLLAVIVVLYEFAHVLAALLRGYKLKLLYIGIPLKDINFMGKKRSTILWKTEKNGVEYGVSWLILGGGVDFYEKPDAPWWDMTIIALAGPIMNLALAFGAFALVAGPKVAFDMTVLTTSVLWAGLVNVFTPQGVAALIGPVGFVSGSVALVQGSATNWLIYWALINMALFIFNLMPIPALDGGHILLSFIIAVFGEKVKKPAEKISYIFLVGLCVLMVLVMLKDVILLFV